MRRTVILYMSTRNDPPEHDVAELIRNSTSGHVAKPFTLNVVITQVEGASKQLAKRFAVE